MASGYVPPDDWLGKLNGSVKDADNRYKSEEKIRAADKAKLLTTSDIISGKWDASRTLLLTSNGRITLTADDLKAFKHNQQVIGKKYEKGITAQQVINHSLQADRDRANKEIKMAVPSGFSNGMLRFITNAGGTTEGVHRHFVTVEFLNYQSEATRSDKNAKQSAFALKKSPLKIGCDCRRWRFWYRYVASVAGFNSGQAETGYPKIRNPNLAGVGCKHILRVMHEILYGGSVVGFIARNMEKAKQHDKNQAQLKNTQKEAEKLAQQQNRRLSSHELKVKQERQRKAAEKAVKKVTPPKKPPRKTSNKQVLKNQAIDAIKRLNLPPEVEASMIAQINSG